MKKRPQTEAELIALIEREREQRRKLPKVAELEARGVVVGKSGRPLTGKALIRYYEQRGRQP